MFVRDLGHGAFALTIIGLTGCMPSAARSPLPPPPSAARPTLLPFPTLPGGGDPLTYDGNLDEIEAFWCTDEGPSTPPLFAQSDETVSDAARWGGIGGPYAGSSSYVLVRGREATIVDTGTWCNAEVLEAGLGELGIGWPDVGSIVVSHKHPDHWVGLSAALALATGATVFAGAPDIPHIESPRPVKPVGAGDRVMGLTIVPTPGHTPGHVAVHDAAAGVLVVGDACAAGQNRTLDMLPTTEDVGRARESLGALVHLSFETLLPGHGFPIIGGAWEAVTEYLASDGN